MKAEGWLNGKAPNIESMKGKVLVIEAWATRCGPCRLVLAPEMVKLQKKYQDKDVVFIGMTDENGPLVPTIQSYLKTTGIGWLNAYGAYDTIVKLGALTGAFGWWIDGDGGMDERVERSGGGRDQAGDQSPREAGSDSEEVNREIGGRGESESVLSADQPDEFGDELAEGSGAVAHLLLDAGVEFSEGQVVFGDEEVGVVAEAVGTAGFGDDDSPAAFFGDGHGGYFLRGPRGRRCRGRRRCVSRGDLGEFAEESGVVFFIGIIFFRRGSEASGFEGTVASGVDAWVPLRASTMSPLSSPIVQVLSWRATSAAFLAAFSAKVRPSSTTSGMLGNSATLTSRME